MEGTKRRGYCPFPVLGRDTAGGVLTGTTCMRTAGRLGIAVCDSTTCARHEVLAARSRHQILFCDTAEVGPG